MEHKKNIGHVDITFFFIKLFKLKDKNKSEYGRSEKKNMEGGERNVRYIKIFGDFFLCQKALLLTFNLCCVLLQVL